jgi:alpha-tubulin suppressor-like RCC1 family protein
MGALAGTAACGLLIGLEDHEAYPAEGGVVPEGSTPDVTTDGSGGHDAGPGDSSTAVDASGDAIHDAGLGCETSCNDACVDLQTDNQNCGTCGMTCTGSTCYRATCGGGAVTQLTAGNEHACALLQAGDVWCWGADDQAQILGPADASTCPLGPCRPTPTQIPGLPNVVQVSAGGAQTCAVDADGGVWCWGANPSGGLGHGPSTDSTCSPGGVGVACNPQPTLVTNLPGPASAVASGQSSFACALVGGSVYCWGDDVYAELGPSDGGSSPVPQLVVTGATAVAAGYQHACALVGGTPTCWGSNVSGELGHSPEAGIDQSCAGSPCNDTPQALTVTGVTRIHAGYHASCFETPSGPVCLGADDVGQLGLDTYDPNANPTPTAVTIEPGTLTSTATMDFGYKTACALASARLYCWGDDETHQTSDPTPGVCTATTGLPCVIDGYRVDLANVVDVHTAPYATFARTSDGHVVAWGNNGAGQLGHPPGDAGDEGGCDPTVFSTPSECNANPVVIQGIP